MHAILVLAFQLATNHPVCNTVPVGYVGSIQSGKWAKNGTKDPLRDRAIICRGDLIFALDRGTVFSGLPSIRISFLSPPFSHEFKISERDSLDQPLDLESEMKKHTEKEPSWMHAILHMLNLHSEQRFVPLRSMSGEDEWEDCISLNGLPGCVLPKLPDRQYKFFVRQYGKAGPPRSYDARTTGLNEAHLSAGATRLPPGLYEVGETLGSDHAWVTFAWLFVVDLKHPPKEAASYPAVHDFAARIAKTDGIQAAIMMRRAFLGSFSLDNTK